MNEWHAMYREYGSGLVAMKKQADNEIFKCSRIIYLHLIIKHSERSVTVYFIAIDNIRQWTVCKTENIA